ncbi:MAG: sigma-E processing peptidase SpoIIGA [Lachnospiraceae bacterium]
MIYIDSYFFLNVWMNLLVLMIYGSVRQYKIKMRRIFMSAASGGAGACILLFLPASVYMIGGIILGVLMSRIAYPIHGVKQTFSEGILLFVSACGLGGVLYVIYYHDFHTGMKVLSTKWLMFQLFWLVPVILIGIFVVRRINKKQKPIYRVILSYQGKEIETQGLWDTGNRLVTAGGSPVSLAERRLLCQLVPEEVYQALEEWPNHSTLEGVLIIPILYQCIGTEQGLLPAIRISKMTIFRENGTITVKNPVIGVGNHKFSNHNQYQMILNSEV